MPYNIFNQPIQSGPGSPLLNFLNSPTTLLGLSVLNNANRPAEGILQGLQFARETELARLRGAAIQQEILRAQQENAVRQQQQAALSEITQPYFNGAAVHQGQGAQTMLSANPAAAAQRVIGAGDLTGGLNLINALTPESAGPKIGAVSPGQFTPASLARYQQTGDFNDLVPMPRAPLVQIGEGGIKPPTGYMLNESGTGVVPIPGGPAERKSPEQAGKQALVESGLAAAQSVHRQLFDTDGSVNRTLLIQMATEAPYTRGRMVASQLREAIGAKLRTETGANAPAAEVEEVYQRFAPALIDNKATVEDKMTRLEQFFKNSLESSDPEKYKRLQQYSSLQKKADANVAKDVEETKVINGRKFIRQSGVWLEVTQ